MKAKTNDSNTTVLRALLFCALIGWFTCAQAQSIQLVKDIYPGQKTEGNLYPTKMVPMGDSLLIIAHSPNDGEDLWLYDGDPSHMQQLTNISVGSGFLDLRDARLMDGIMYLVVERWGRTELLRTDGSTAGTYSVYAFADQSQYHDMAVHNGRLLLLVRNGDYNSQVSLWSSDGTQAGTDSIAGPFYTPWKMEFVEMQGELFFASRFQVHKTNGLPGGTVPLWTSGLIYNIDRLVAYNDRLWFVGYEYVHGYELWSCDSSVAAPVLHDDYNPGIANGAVPGAPIFACDGRLFYMSTDDGLLYGSELRSTSGNAASATVMNWTAGADGSNFSSVAAADHFFFMHSAIPNANVVGSSAGLQSAPENGSVFPDPANHLIKGDTVIFATYNNARNLWIAKGSMNNIVPYDTARSIYVQALCAWRDSVAVSYSPSGAWQTGTMAAALDATGTRELPQMPSTGISSYPGYFYPDQGHVFFPATDSAGGKQVWVTDGTTAGTQSLGDIMPGPSGAWNGYRFASFHGEVYWVDEDPQHGWEVWASDGTPAGTRRVTDLCPGTCSGSIGPLMPTDDFLYFSARPHPLGKVRTFRVDGTSAGPVSVGDLLSASTSVTEPWVRLGNNMLLLAYDYSQVNYPYYLGVTSGGAGPGTTLARMTNRPVSPTYMDNHIYFVAPDSNHLTQLWRTNGTQAGTYTITSFTALNPSDVEIWGVLNGKLILSYSTPALGKEIYVSDGTEAGTQLLMDVYPGTSGGSVGRLAGDDQKIYFLGRTASTGQELWVTDGTVAGTVIVDDFSSGTASTMFSSMGIHAGTLYGTMRVGDEYMVFVTDGTAFGTDTYDAAPDAGSGILNYFGLTDQGLLLLAHADSTGSNLYLANQGVMTPLPDPTGDPRSIFVGDIAMSPNGIVMGLYTPDLGMELWRLDGLSLLTGAPRAAVPTEAHAGLRAYPVPAQAQVSVRSNDAQAGIKAWQLLNLRGQAVAEGALAPGMDCDIDLAGLPSGLYIVRATLRNGRTAAIKVVKE